MGMRGALMASGRVKEARISAVITRADGSVVELGELTYWHRNPLRRWARSIRKLLRGN